MGTGFGREKDMNKKRKTAGILLLVLCFLMGMILPVSAETEENWAEEMYRDSGILDLESQIPEEARAQFPSIDALADMASFSASEHWLSYLFGTAGDAFLEALRSLGLLLGILLLASLFRMLQKSMKNDALEGAMSLVSSLVCGLAVFGILQTALQTTLSLLDTLHVTMTTCAAVVVGLCTASGFPVTGAMMQTALMFFLVVLENLCHFLLTPAVQVCFGLALVSSMTNSVNLGGISAVLRKTFTFLLGGLMAVLAAVFAYQTVIAQSADSVSMRTIKFALGNMIPIVGGAVSEAAQVVAGGMKSIRGAAGAVSIAVLLLILLPPLIAVAVQQLYFRLCSVIAQMLDLKREETLMKEAGELCGFLIAVMVSVSLLFIFTLVMFIGIQSGMS